MKNILGLLKPHLATILLLIGLFLFLLGSLYLFTRPCVFCSFDFSATGQIGDTIGGITAPIVNIIGATLVYLSFKAQISANKIQFDLLQSQIDIGRNDRNFEITLTLFSQLKDDFLKLKFEDANGKAAVNVFLNKLQRLTNKESITDHLNKNIHHELSFVINEYKLIVKRIQKVEMAEHEKEQLFYIIISFYAAYLHTPCRILRKTYDSQNIEKRQLKSITDIIETHKIISDSLKE